MAAQMTKLYAGIGSRTTPVAVLNTMQQCAFFLASEGFFLRSGGARGADAYFEMGHEGPRPSIGSKRIFRAREAALHPEWFDHARQYHPAWAICSGYAKSLHARNSAIILGETLNEPVDFVICWTKDGKASGGTGQALRVAAAHNIPIYNLFELRRLPELWTDLGYEVNAL